MRTVCSLVLAATLLAGCSHVRTAAVGNSQNAAAAPAAGASPCAQVANEMAGIEGWAPGAGHALQMGRSNTQSFGGFGGALAGGGSESAATAAPTLPPCAAPPLDPNDPIAKLPAPSGKLWSSIDAAQSALPRQRYDVAAAAASLGRNVQASYEFIRDRFALDAYPGVMRGAQGTLIAGAGNPDDQAVLLAALLKANGFTVRFARSTLSDADAAVLTQRVTAFIPQPFPTTDPNATIASLGLNESDLSAKLTPIYDSAVARAKQQIASAASLANAMNARLTSNGVTIGTSPAGERAQWVEELRTHYYVQVQQNGAWTDLDPSSGGALGKHLGSTDASFTAESMPQDRYATVRFQIVADSLQGSSLTSATLLDQTVNAADAVAKPLYLNVVPSNDTSTRDINGSTAFLPTLTGGDGSTNGTAFTLLQGGAQVARLRLQIDSSAPGRKTTTYTRILYDRLDPATQNTLASAWNDPAKSAQLLPFDAAIVIAPGELTQPFLLWANLETMKSLQAVGKGAQQRIAFPIDILRFFERDANLSHGIAASMGNPSRFMHDRADIVMDVVNSSSRDAKLGWNARFDIVENGMTAIAPDNARAAYANLSRGIADEAIESAIAGPGALTTTSVLGSVDATRNDLAVITPAKRDALASMHLPPVWAAALAASLSQGHVAISLQSAKDGNVPWWDVDPATGYAVARLNDGSGQAEVEYEETTEEVDPFFKICGEDLTRCIKIANHFNHFMKCGAAHPGHGAACVADAACNVGFSALAGALGDGVWEDMPGKGWGEVGLDMGLGSIGFGPGENACGAAFGTGESEGGE